MAIDVRKFVPKEVFVQFGEKSSQFVSDNIIKIYTGIDAWFTTHFKDLDSNVEKVEVVVNNWYSPELIKICGQTFNWRGLRTYKYIDGLVEAGKSVATLSQHIGGSTNAIDINVILYFKGGKTLIINSDTIHDLITKNQKAFMDMGVTTLEDKAMTKGWTHIDSRYVGQTTIYIVKP